MPVINANSIDPDQTPRSAASDLGLHCLPMSHLWDVRHKWVNKYNKMYGSRFVLIPTKVYMYVTQFCIFYALLEFRK